MKRRSLFIKARCAAPLAFGARRRAGLHPARALGTVCPALASAKCVCVPASVGQAAGDYRCQLLTGCAALKVRVPMSRERARGGVGAREQTASANALQRFVRARRAARFGTVRLHSINRGCCVSSARPDFTLSATPSYRPLVPTVSRIFFTMVRRFCQMSF